MLRVALCGLLLVATHIHAQTCPAGNPRVAPDSRYSVTEPVSGQRVVTDLRTGLMWKQCVQGRSGAGCATGTDSILTWTEALTAANAENHAGHSDWRLPSLIELRSLIESGCHTPAINTTVFPNASSDAVRSSTTVAPTNNGAWSVFFENGDTFTTAKSPLGERVRLVRGGGLLDGFNSGLDFTPNSYTFAAQSDVPLSSLRTSNSVSVSGITTVTSVGISGAAGSQYRINGAGWTSAPGQISNGDLIEVRHTSAATPVTITTTTLTIGGVSAGFNTATASGGSALRLNDSGQTTCYDATASTGTVASATPDPETAGFNEQDCTRGAAAADALGRMAKVGASTAPGRDYTKIANDGSELPASATLGTGPGDWACTRDNVTGLIWEVKTTSGLRSVDGRYVWYDTNPAVNGGNPGTEASSGCGSTLPNCNTSAYRDAINALTGPARLCGAADWRMPSRAELTSLLHFGVSVPAIDGTWFPNTVGVSYWSGTSVATVPNEAWRVGFQTGLISNVAKNALQPVRLVRGGL